MNKKIISFATVICLLFSSFVFAKVDYNPTNEFFVNDFAGILSEDTKKDIMTKGEQIQNATTAQLVVVTVPNMGGKDIETYSNELFNSWKIGDKEKDNGILLLISKEDRKVRIEVGYGLEGAMNDAKAGRIIDDVAMEHLKNNDYNTAVKNIATQLQAIIYNEYGVEGGYDNYKEEEMTGAEAMVGIGIFIIVLVICIASSRRGIFFIGGPGGFGGGSSGGFGGGGFGGFSGGGGSSGGGGASRGF